MTIRVSDSLKGTLAITNHIHLIYCQHNVAYAQQTYKQRMATRLGDNTLRGIDKNYRQVGS
jgi:hypothetical protein